MVEQKIDTLNQPDADRSEWAIKTLNYDETLAVLNDETAIKPEFDFDDDVLNKIRADKPELKSDESLEAVIADKYQQILLARYNKDQEDSNTINDGIG